MYQLSLSPSSTLNFLVNGVPGFVEIGHILLNSSVSRLEVRVRLLHWCLHCWFLATTHDHLTCADHAVLRECWLLLLVILLLGWSTTTIDSARLLLVLYHDLKPLLKVFLHADTAHF